MGNPNELSLRLFCLEVQAAQNTLTRVDAVVLYKRMLYSKQLLVTILLECFKYMAAFVAENGGADELNIGNGCVDYVHEAPKASCFR